MKTWWQNKNLREQRLILLMAISVIIMFFWYGVISPVSKVSSQLMADYKKSASELVWLKNEITQQGVVPVLPISGSFEELARKTAGQVKLKINTINTEQQDLVVKLDPLPLVQLSAWLDLLKTKYGIRASKLELSASAEEGNLVKVDALNLRRATADE